MTPTIRNTLIGRMRSYHWDKNGYEYTIQIYLPEVLIRRWSYINIHFRTALTLSREIFGISILGFGFGFGRRRKKDG